MQPWPVYFECSKYNEISLGNNQGLLFTALVYTKSKTAHLPQTASPSNVITTRSGIAVAQHSGSDGSSYLLFYDCEFRETMTDPRRLD